MRCRLLPQRLLCRKQACRWQSTSFRSYTCTWRSCNQTSNTRTWRSCNQTSNTRTWCSCNQTSNTRTWRNCYKHHIMNVLMCVVGGHVRLQQACVTCAYVPHECEQCDHDDTGEPAGFGERLRHCQRSGADDQVKDEHQSNLATHSNDSTRTCTYLYALLWFTSTNIIHSEASHLNINNKWTGLCAHLPRMLFAVEYHCALTIGECA